MSSFRALDTRKTDFKRLRSTKRAFPVFPVDRVRARFRRGEAHSRETRGTKRSLACVRGESSDEIADCVRVTNREEMKRGNFENVTFRRDA